MIWWAGGQLEAVECNFPKEVAFQRRPGDQAQPLSMRQQPAQVGEQPEPRSPAGAPGGAAPADESCAFKPKARASLLAERPLTLFSAYLRESCGAVPGENPDDPL